MEKYEAVAKTADEAIEEILSEMEVTIDEVEIDIEEAKQGLFGFLKQKQVKVTATLKDSDSPKAKKLKEKRKAKEESEKTKKSEEKTSEKQEKVYEANPALVNDPTELIHEFFHNIANGINKEFEVNIENKDNLIKVDIYGEDVSLLIGKHGRTLDSIRSLLSLMINRGRAKEDLKRVLVDVEGYRKKRDNTLERLARSTATKVIKTKKEIAMEPMNPYERRIVHSVLQRNKLVATRSEGDEPARYVVVFLK